MKEHPQEPTDFIPILNSTRQENTWGYSNRASPEAPLLNFVQNFRNNEANFRLVWIRPISGAISPSHLRKVPMGSVTSRAWRRRPNSAFHAGSLTNRSPCRLPVHYQDR